MIVIVIIDDIVIEVEGIDVINILVVVIYVVEDVGMMDELV